MASVRHMPKKPGTPRQPAAPLPPRSSSTSKVVIALLAVLLTIGIFAYLHVRTGLAQTGQAPRAAVTPGTERGSSASPDSQVEGPPAYARFGPHKQAVLPPLPSSQYPLPRPQDVVAGVYRFAAEHPEVLGYVPCYCGCEKGGHRGNDDCFVSARAANGDVTAWEPHGVT